MRPGGNPGHNDRPGHGGSVGNHRPDRPGNPGFRPGASSVPRPGSWSHASRPHYNYRNPGYRPPRPGGGYWGAPPPSPYRINYWVPPVPRYVSVVRTVPTIGTVLGLAFGSFIDAGINALYNAGYTVNGYYNDAIYLSNVRQLGYLWPEAIVQYNDGLMSGTQFYNWSAVPDQNMYYSLYNQLTASYGTPGRDLLLQLRSHGHMVGRRQHRIHNPLLWLWPFGHGSEQLLHLADLHRLLREVRIGIRIKSRVRTIRCGPCCYRTYARCMSVLSYLATLVDFTVPSALTARMMYMPLSGSLLRRWPWKL